MIYRFPHTEMIAPWRHTYPPNIRWFYHAPRSWWLLRRWGRVGMPIVYLPNF